MIKRLITNVNFSLIYKPKIKLIRANISYNVDLKDEIDKCD